MGKSGRIRKWIMRENEFVKILENYFSMST